MLLLRSLIAILPLVAPLVAGAALNKRQGPTLYLFGDSTMATCRYGPVYATESAGWGTTLASWLDISVINDARSGYSARQAHREKIYDAALATAQPGDMVVIQWGRNDVWSPNEATLHKRPCDPVNNNFDTVCEGPSSDEPEVYTFVKYMIMAAKAFQEKGVNVIITSLTTKSTFQDDIGTFKEEQSNLIDWANQAAEMSGSSYIDMHASMTRWYERLGANEVKKCYLTEAQVGKKDFTHTTLRGAEVAARSFIAALLRSDIALKSFIRSTPTQIVNPNCGAR